MNYNLIEPNVNYYQNLWLRRKAIKTIYFFAVVSLLTLFIIAVGWSLSQKFEIPYTWGKSNILAYLYTNHAIKEIFIEQTKIVSCYYNTPIPDTANQLQPKDIHPFLCTHINVAFAQIIDKKIVLEDHQYKSLSEVVKLKITNPKIKILLSVGGSGNENGFSEMVESHANRKVFIKSMKNILHDYTLDGIDLDWEFPAVHSNNLHHGKRERQHFSQLLREIRTEYMREKKPYILTVAAAAPEIIVDAAYDIDQLNLYTDYVNIMTYDFHYYSKYTPFTGLNSPLYQRHEEQLYMATLNINYTVHLYLHRGLARSKIVIGIPTYGHSFSLVNPDNARIGSPSSGVGSLGGVGFVSYLDICLFLKSNRDVVIKQDIEAMVPYMYRGKEWVSYDSPESVARKAAYIKQAGLGGAMIYSLNADDFQGVCQQLPLGNHQFPLIHTIKNTLCGNNSINDVNQH